MKISKAIITVEDGKSSDLPPALQGPLEVQFNPTEYSLSKSVQIAEIGIPGLESPLLQFVRGQNEKLALDLFFDVTGDDSGKKRKKVTELTDPFFALVKVIPKTHAIPRIQFTWGEGLSFKAVVESITQKFTLFDPDGIPLRATLSMSFKRYRTLQEQLEELKLESSDHTKSKVVQQGETLSGIAAKEYGDPGIWREIWMKNLDVVPNPRRLEPGVVLQIPRIDPQVSVLTRE